jgi:MerR family transcriptional regulator, copper efflux regulator
MNVHVRVLSIGTLAKAAGVTTPTIRYYEDIGLLPKPERNASGQRIYDEGDVERLTFIRRCRDFGFSIDQVRLLASLSISPDRDCAEVRDIASEHLTDVRAKLAELKALEQSLAGFVDRCDIACSGGPGRECLVFKDITKPEDRGCC